MATTTSTISEQEYRELAMNDYKTKRELWDGVLVEKPPVTLWHGIVASYLGFSLANQLDRREFRLNVNSGRARFTARNYLVPDVIVIPASYVLPYIKDPGALGAYADPLPLVADLWSPPADGYDIAAKPPIYRERGDLEIWLIHPDERTLTAWRKQPDGSYTEDLYRGGIIPVLSLSSVTIDLDALLDD